jgi:drug/metabolite transporter (DMT)-like permease
LHQDRKTWAITILSIGIAMTGLQDTFMKYLSGDYPFHQLQVIRSLIALAIVGLGGLVAGSFRQVDWHSMRPVILRGLFIGAGSAFYYVSLAAMTLADATAIYFALPLIVSALAGIILGERVQSWRWAAAFVGFIGVLITIRPGSGLFEPAALLTLIATFLYAAGNLTTRRISPTVPPFIIALVGGIAFAAVALVLAAVFGTGRFYNEAHPSLAFLTRAWTMPSLNDWGLLFGFGLATATGFFSYAEAYRNAPASFVAPFEYSAMIWALLFGWWIFGDVPVLTSMIGSAVIIGSGLWLGWREWRQSRSQQALAR